MHLIFPEQLAWGNETEMGCWWKEWSVCKTHALPVNEMFKAQIHLLRFHALRIQMFSPLVHKKHFILQMDIGVLRGRPLIIWGRGDWWKMNPYSVMMKNDLGGLTITRKVEAEYPGFCMYRWGTLGLWDLCCRHPSSSCSWHSSASSS